MHHDLCSFCVSSTGATMVDCLGLCYSADVYESVRVGWGQMDVNLRVAEKTRS